MQFRVTCYHLIVVRRRLDVGAETLSNLAGSVQEARFTHTLFVFLLSTLIA